MEDETKRETQFCQNCGAEWPLDTKFCTKCGTWMETGEKVETPRPEKGDVKKKYRFKPLPPEEKPIPKIDTARIEAEALRKRRPKSKRFGIVVFSILSILVIIYCGITIFFKPFKSYLLGKIFEKFGVEENALRQYQKIKRNPKLYGSKWQDMAKGATKNMAKKVLGKNLDTMNYKSWAANVEILNVKTKVQLTGRRLYKYPGKIRFSVYRNKKGIAVKIINDEIFYMWMGVPQPHQLKLPISEHSKKTEELLDLSWTDISNPSKKNKLLKAFSESSDFDLNEIIDINGKKMYVIYFPVSPENKEKISFIFELGFGGLLLELMDARSVKGWYGAKDGFLYKLEYYDENQNVIVSRSYKDVNLNPDLDDNLFRLKSRK